MAVLGEKLRSVPQTAQPGWEVESGALFLGAVNLSSFVGSAWKVAMYGDHPQEAYVGRTWTDVESVRVVLIEFSPAGCISIRIAATLGYE
jgi:hypothetical protein